jgi:hypothetical protein
MRQYTLLSTTQIVHISLTFCNIIISIILLEYYASIELLSCWANKLKYRKRNNGSWILSVCQFRLVKPGVRGNIFDVKPCRGTIWITGTISE